MKRIGNRVIIAVVLVAALFVFNLTTAAADLEMELSCPPPPGTGTPGYWMNHPEAWPLDCVVGIPKAAAIVLMGLPTQGNKILTMFPALAAAELNVAAGNDDSCIEDVIAAAGDWLGDCGGVGAVVKANSPAWQDGGEDLYEVLDAYNNGELCAPSRDWLEMELSCPPPPGTGTPGYWMNHPKAWPLDCVVGIPKVAAIVLMGLPTQGNKILTMFPALAAAELNVAAGSDDSCIEDVIAAAGDWLGDCGGVGAVVKANSPAWQDGGEDLYEVLDAYNNGELCAPSRDWLEMELSCLPSPGTGTPGYWMNHPDAWPTQWIVVIPGELMYPKYEAIGIMKAPVMGDKTLTLFSAWVAAILNRRIGNDTTCVNVEIGEARYWLGSHPPGSGVTASSAEWKEAEPWYEELDAYNNGELCVPSRDALE